MKHLYFYFTKIAALIVNLLLFIVVGVFAADQRCDFRLATCPESFNGQSIYVPKKVTAFAPDFYVCKPTKVIENVGGKVQPPSIMFVIDNSTSMSGINNNNPNDSGGVRFKVTSALLDTIYSKYPGAEVGLTVFQDVLCFDTRDDLNFVGLPADYKAFPRTGYETQGYIPLLKLDSTVAGGIKAIDLLKKYLQTEPITLNNNLSSNILKYKPQFELTQGTNINTAFDAARFAMLKAIHPKENQFVIFLSDGEPNSDWPRTPTDFENGLTMPTTFTVYFLATAGAPVPRSIETMTTNIRNNGYSTNNQLSEYWGMQASFEGLLSSLMSKAITSIFSTIKQEPTTLKLNGVTYKDYNEEDSTFFLPGGLPLKDSITNVKVEIKYKVVKDSSGASYDSTVNVEFNIVRSDNMAQSNGILLNCRDTVLYQVSVNATDPSAAEKDADPGTIEFTRNNSGGDLAVYFTISGTATKKADYTTIVDTVYFLPGQTKSSLEIKPIADVNEEGDETVVVRLLSTKNGRTIRYGINQPDSAVVTIHDLVKDDTVNVAVLINPFSPSAVVLDTIRAMYNQGKISGTVFQNLKSIAERPEYKSGTFITIQTSKQLKPLTSDNTVFGKTVIFDALGNKVKDLEIKDMDKDHGRYTAFWDGTNHIHRRVGNGVYLMKMNFTNTEGKTTKIISKIGVKN